RRAEIFIARHRNSRLTDQASVPARYRRRLVWGTALRMGLRMQPLVDTGASCMRFALPDRLPPEEERLMSAFGRIRYVRPAAFQYSISHVAISTAKAALGRLGIII